LTVPALPLPLAAPLVVPATADFRFVAITECPKLRNADAGRILIR
jgi:hypothetical protein